MRLTLSKLNSNEVTFQVLNSIGHKTWIPRAMVKVVSETDGSVTFDADDALVFRLRLAAGVQRPVDGVAPDEGRLASRESNMKPQPVFNPRTDQLFTPSPQAQLTFQPEARVTLKAPLTEGRYTVVFNGDLEDYVTVRVARWDSRKDTLIFSFLKGPDNGNDYISFAEYQEQVHKFRVWAKFRSPGFNRQVDAVRHLLGMDEEAMYEAGEAYALRSSNCCKCGRDLTRATSIKRGMGADCWVKYAPMAELQRMVEDAKRKNSRRKTSVIVTDVDGQRAVALDELSGGEADED